MADEALLAANTALRAMDLVLVHEDVAPDQRIDGVSTVGAVALCGPHGTTVGVWEITPGVSRDVETDEVFVVLAGQAVVSFGDGTPDLVLAPGSVGRLAAGTPTVWRVSETLRKVYLMPRPAARPPASR